MDMKNTMHMIMSEFIKNASRSEGRKLLIPMELSAGWPSIVIKNKQICVILPYFKVQIGKDKQVFLFPISYVTTLTWPNGGMISFSALKYDKEYNKGIDFSKPVGIFKHDAVKNVTKEEYNDMRIRLFAFYDELIEGIVEKKDFGSVEEMRALFQKLMEPSLYPMYKNIARNFFESYCGL